MIKLKAAGKSYSVPNSWNEISYKQYLKIKNPKNKKPEKIISILSKIPLKTVNRFDDQGIQKLILALSFIKNPIEIDNYKAPKKIFTNNKKLITPEADIKSKSYEQKILIHILLKDNIKDITPVLEDIVLIYSQEKIDNSEFNINRLEKLKNSFSSVNFIDLYSTALLYINQLKEIIELEELHLKTDPTPDQKAAGLELFNEFGVMNTIKALAGGDILKYNEVVKLEYNLVFTHLKMNKVSKVYQENYSTILRNKSRRK